MKAKEVLTVSTLRMITSSIKNIEISNRTSSSEESLDEAGIIQLLSKMVKQRKESAEIYSTSNRGDLEKKENDEINIIQKYMPAQMDDIEIDLVISKVIKETDSNGIRDMGKVMNFLKENYSGEMDFGKISGIVKGKLES
jgi:uncharacterized protein YqeY